MLHVKKTQQEIDNNIGGQRWAEETDIKHLVYLQAVVMSKKHRLNPPGPLSVPHQATEDCQVNGYLIPKGTQLFVNIWEAAPRPRILLWAGSFFPERFLTSQAKVDVHGYHF